MLGDLLPAALAIALTPVPIVALVLLLGGPRARTSGPAFLGGWVLGLVAVGALASVIFDGADQADSPESLAGYWMKVVVGLVFFALAFKMWRKRPAPGAEPEMPSWMASMESVTPGRAFVFGLAFSAANPKNLALTLAAAASVAEAGYDEVGVGLVLAIFVLLSSIGVIGIVGFFMVAPRRAARPLASLREFMAANSTVMSMTLLAVLGALVLGDGIGGLAGAPP